MLSRLRKPGPLLLLATLLQGCAALPAAETPDNDGKGPLARLVGQVVDDHERHYSADALLDLLPPLAVAGALANTNADRWIRDTWQNDARSDASNDFARIFLRVGDAGQNRISFPLYSLTLFATGYSGHEDRDAALATWAARSLRANILGGPQAWALTYMLGSHRPDVGHSGWNPWHDNDGVSGHSFYGAVPILTAARMLESPAWRYSLYAVSMLPAFARINDNQHYTSQAVMGWSLAWLATRTVAGPDDENDVVVLPVLTPDGGYVLLSWRF
ncbi:MAG TPA: phosphatase PAP2 family protein [Gammaproteobacteria bacterium]